MTGLSEQDLLLLNNFMYITGSADVNGSVGNIAEELLREGFSEDDLSGSITVEQAESILQELQSSENLKDLTIQSSIDNEGVRASCFVDSQGNATVAFRGTGGSYEAWSDNVRGEFLADTQYQKQAADFVRNSCGAYDNITITGHSKGGNLAQYCTVVCGDQIGRCVSYDGQGFNEDFLRKYASEIARNQGKIKSVCAEADYVNILLTSIAGSTVYLETEEEANPHLSWELYRKNKDRLDAEGNFAHTVEQSAAMQGLDAALDGLVSALGLLPEEKESGIMNVLASCVGAFFALTGGSFGKEEYQKWCRDQCISALVFTARERELLSALYDMLTGKQKEQPGGRKDHKDTAGQGMADFYVDCGRLKESVGEFAAMEQELDRACARLEAIDLPGQLCRNPELEQTLRILREEVRAEKESMKQMKEVLVAVIKCYQDTERHLVELAV